jgi:hypothetical protein
MNIQSFPSWWMRWEGREVWRLRGPTEDEYSEFSELVDEVGGEGGVREGERARQEGKREGFSA